MKVIGICDDEELAARRLERMIREMLGKRPELYGTRVGDPPLFFRGGTAGGGRGLHRDFSGCENARDGRLSRRGGAS